MGASAAPNTFVSLGDHCLPSSLLRAAGLRLKSHPFDWLFTSPEIVAHAIADDFQIFLDRGQMVSSRHPSTGAPAAQHRFYKALSGVETMFFHHDPALNDDHYAHLQRAVQRLRDAADDPIRFVLAVGENCADTRIEDLWEVVRARFPQSTLTAVKLSAAASMHPITQVHRDVGGLAIIGLSPSSTNSGLEFDRMHDDAALLRLFLREHAPV